MGAPDGFAPGHKLEGDVVENEIGSLIVPDVEVEHSAHVYVASQRTSPFGLSESGWAKEDERFGTFRVLLRVGELISNEYCN